MKQSGEARADQTSQTDTPTETQASSSTASNQNSGRTADARVVIHFRDLSTDLDLKAHIEQRCSHLAHEFPETEHYEMTLEPDALHVKAHGHVSGKRTDVAAHVQGVAALRAAADQLIDKLERELRKEHDKRIFGQRRRAQRTRVKRQV